MAIYSALTPEYLQTRLEVINRAALVVVDANLTEEALRFIGQNVTVPVFADPVSTPKCRHLNGVLNAAAGIKPNRPEASLMTGVEIRTDDDLAAAAAVFHAKGVQNVFISLGGRGVYYDNGEEKGILPIFGGEIINTNGCGDAFLAAAADGYLMGLTLKQCAQRGLAASCLCAQSESAVSPLINTEDVTKLSQYKED
jgi:pseudouridine kinase